jgi:hypothetical protein
MYKLKFVNVLQERYVGEREWRQVMKMMSKEEHEL